MIQIIWKFQVIPSQTTQFEQLYGPNGKWSLLFQQSTGYKETILLRDKDIPGKYCTIDCWTDLNAFDRFYKQFSKAYEALDQECERLTLSEQKVGVFDKVDK